MSFRTVVITRQSKITYKNRFLVVKQENDEKYTTGFKAGNKVKEFSINVEFKWGEKFGGENPGIYFDDGDGASKTIEEVTEMMDNFKTTIGESQTYKVTLTAIAKGQSK